MIDDFNLPLDIKTQHLSYEAMLSLEQHKNVLEMFPVKLRSINQ